MKKIVLASALVLFAPLAVHAQEESSEPKNQLSINVLHTPVVYAVSASMSGDVNYVPIHVGYVRSFSKNVGLSVLALYRHDQDEDFKTNEIGIAVGPRFSFGHNRAWFVECKVGLGVASGVDYFNNDYTRWDLVVQPDIGYTRRIGSHFSITGGIGLQTLVLLSETPSRSGYWDWNDTGTLSHYYLPVANLSIGVAF